MGCAWYRFIVEIIQKDSKNYQNSPSNFKKIIFLFITCKTMQNGSSHMTNINLILEHISYQIYSQKIHVQYFQPQNKNKNNIFLKNSSQLSFPQWRWDGFFEENICLIILLLIFNNFKYRNFKKLLKIFKMHTLKYRKKKAQIILLPTKSTNMWLKWAFFTRNLGKNRFWNQIYAFIICKGLKKFF